MQTTMVFILLLGISMFTASVRAQQDSLLDQIRELRERIDPRPAHPEFTDPISADSPNAVGRYIWLDSQTAWQDTYHASSIELDLDVWRWYEYQEELELPEGVRPVSEWRTWLEKNRALTDSIVEAAGLGAFDLRFGPNPDSVYEHEDDPRNMLLSKIRRFIRILRDDAVRLWIEGEREAAIDRTEAIVRMGLQVRGDGRVSIIQSLVAGSMLRDPMPLIEAMAAEELTDAERERLIAVCILVPTNDSTGVHTAWTMTSAEMIEFTTRELETERGGDALWLRLGELVGIQVAFDQIFRPFLDSFEQDDGDESDQVAAPPDRETLVADFIREIDDRFKNVTHEDMAESLRLSIEWRERVLQLWQVNSRSADRSIRECEAFVESDETMIAMLILGSVERFRNDGIRTVQARNQAIAVLCGADPAP